MAISRGLQPRQLRENGGIMEAVPRQGYFLGKLVKSVKKGVKGLAKGVKKFAKSDLGKVALLAGGAYFAPTLFGGKAGFGSFGNMLKSGIGSLGSKIVGGGALPPSQGLGQSKGIFSKFFGGPSTLGKTLAVQGAGTLIGGLMAKAEEGDEEAVAATRNVDALRSYLTKGARNLGYSESEIPGLVEENVAEYTSGAGGYAEGGRIGYAEGTDDYEDKFMKLVSELREAGFSQQEAIEEAREQLGRKLAKGGRVEYAMGSPEQNAVRAAGIMNLPLNQNPAGVTELDLRETGGFIPPVGVKEKADDIPAMLANNEFVFTADAVRGMGDGDVNKGAQRMYDMMRKLEKGGRV